MEEIVWVVGKHLGIDGAWELQGVFTNKALAVSAIRHSNYFIAEFPLNQSMPDETVEWDVRYPLLEGL